MVTSIVNNRFLNFHIDNRFSIVYRLIQRLHKWTFLVFLCLKLASVRRKSEDRTYSDFPIESCTPVGNSRDVYISIENLAIDLAALFRKSSVLAGVE